MVAQEDPMLTVLYHEERTKPPVDMYGYHENLVHVSLRRWMQGSENDVVLSVRVRLDGEWILNYREAFDGHGRTDAEFQRMAIKRFDDCLAGHPTIQDP
jgi:hypothetical protein